MNEKMLYEMAYTVCRVIEEKNRLQAENEYLKKELQLHDERLANSIKEDEKFIGDVLVSMIKGIRN